MINILFWIIEKIAENKPPGKKTLQKIIYLISRKDNILGGSLAYAIHYYGPYSSTLDYYLQSLERLGAIEIKAKGLSSIITLSGYGKDLITADEEFEAPPDFKKLVEYVIDTFSSLAPKELELLTTTDFVAQEILRYSKVEDDEIIKGVEKIKGDKFPKNQIVWAIETLRNTNYLPV